MEHEGGHQALLRFAWEQGRQKKLAAHPLRGLRRVCLRSPWLSISLNARIGTRRHRRHWVQHDEHHCHTTILLPGAPRACRRRAASMIRAASTMPAASASSPTSTTQEPQDHCRRPEHPAGISNIAAPSAPIPKAGDGAGVLLQIPHAFFAGEAARLGFALPAPQHYGVGYLFMPREPIYRQDIERIWWETAREEGLKILGWRDVPVDPSVLGASVRGHRALPSPAVHRPRADHPRRSVISSASCSSAARWCRTACSKSWADKARAYYPVSVSSRTIVYKGLVLGKELGAYYRDLGDERRRIGPRAGASALLDQHLPVLAAGPSLSLHLPQWRDQHACAATSTGWRRARPT